MEPGTKLGPYEITGAGVAHSVLRRQLTVLIVAALSLLPALGCASANVDTVRMDPAVRQQRVPAEVQFLTQKPERPHKVIAVVRVDDGAAGMSLGKLMEILRKEAAALGGDAVILGHLSKSTRNANSFMPGEWNLSLPIPQLNLMGQVIVYEDHVVGHEGEDAERKILRESAIVALLDRDADGEQKGPGEHRQDRTVLR